MEILWQAALVALGSAIGGLTRWGVATWAKAWLGTAFPYGTFLINVSGSMFLGWFATVLADQAAPGRAPWPVRPADLQLAVAVGFTGAYTTFSTFELETNTLLGNGDGWAAAAYVAGSVFLGLMAVKVGVLLARWG